MSTNATRMKAVLLALGIFVLGAALGATYQRWGPPGKGQGISDRSERRRTPPFGPTSERLLNRYVRNLELTGEQRTEIEKILDEGRITMGKMRREIRAKTESVTRKTRARIRDLLTPDQQGEIRRIDKPRISGNYPATTHQRSPTSTWNNRRLLEVSSRKIGRRCKKCAGRSESS